MAKAPTDIRSRARAHTDKAIRVLVEIMENRSAPYMARALAATEILNRGFGQLIDATQYVPRQQQFYVYSVHNASGRLVYIGKGTNRRHLDSARRLGGRSRVRAEFSNEKKALEFEGRLIKRFRPPFNTVYARSV